MRQPLRVINHMARWQEWGQLTGRSDGAAISLASGFPSSPQARSVPADDSSGTRHLLLKEVVSPEILSVEESLSKKDLLGPLHFPYHPRIATHTGSSLDCG